jgi:hypothetical protein
MRFPLRTLLIATTFAGLTCGGWSLSLNAAARGGVNVAAQLLILLASWVVAVIFIVPRR